MYIAIIAAGVLVLIILAGAHLLFPFRSINYRRFPVAEGAEGNDFSVKSADGIPFLVENSLPYPTFFEKKSYSRQSLTGKWKMKFDPGEEGEKEEWFLLKSFDRSWKQVTVPSTYNTAESEITSYEGITWYSTLFSLQLKPGENHFLRLCFEGVLIRCTVWLNGRLIIQREGGYTPFYCDITDTLQKGANTLVVKTDNRHTTESLPPRLGTYHVPGWHSYGGIHREVYIEAVPNLSLFKAAATAELNKNSANLNLDLLIWNRSGEPDYSVTCNLYGPDRKELDSVKLFSPNQEEVDCHRLSFTVKNPSLWRPENPALYEIRFKIKSVNSESSVSFKTGLRTITVQGEDILLNGKKIFLKGICKHEDHPKYGATQTREVIKKDLSLIKKMNANYIRLAHYPHHVDELVAARDMGFLMSEEIPMYQAGTGFVPWYSDNQKFSLFPFRTFGYRHLLNKMLMLNSQKQLIEMIERDRNNPAIIIWGVANETYTLSDRAGRYFGWLHDIAKAFDPTRPTTVAELTYGMPVLDSKRSSGKYVEIISLNVYYGWYYGAMEELENHIDNYRIRMPEKPVLLSEYGAGAAPGRMDRDGIWKAERVSYGKTYSEEYQERLIEHYWNVAKSRDYIAGLSPWVFADFYCTEFPNNPVPNYNLKGVVSGNRKPKLSYKKLSLLYKGRNK